MLKLKSISIFTLISTLMLFLFITPIFASDVKSCSVSSEGAEICIITTPTAGAASSPGSTGSGTIDPSASIVEPIPAIPMEKTIAGTGLPIEVKPSETATQPVKSAPDEGLIVSTTTPSPIEENPGIAEDSISKNDIRYLRAGKSSLEGITLASPFSYPIGWVAGLTLIASFTGGLVYAQHARKNKK